MLLSQAAKKHIPPNFDDSSLSLKARRRMIQLVKNRVAAQKTREKRRNLLQEALDESKQLSEQNKKLMEQNAILLARIKQLEESQGVFSGDISGIEQRNNLSEGAQDKTEENKAAISVDLDHMQNFETEGLITSEPVSDVFTRTPANNRGSSQLKKTFALMIIIAIFYSFTLMDIDRVNQIEVDSQSLHEAVDRRMDIEHDINFQRAIENNEQKQNSKDHPGQNEENYWIIINEFSNTIPAQKSIVEASTDEKFTYETFSKVHYTEADSSVADSQFIGRPTYSNRSSETEFNELSGEISDMLNHTVLEVNLYIFVHNCLGSLIMT